MEAEMILLWLEMTKMRKILKLLTNNEMKIKHSEVIKCFDIFIQWSSQKNINILKPLALREIVKEALQMSLQVTCKRTFINDFFSANLNNF